MRSGKLTQPHLRGGVLKRELEETALTAGYLRGEEQLQCEGGEGS